MHYSYESLCGSVGKDFVYSRLQTINNIVNIRRIDNIIDRVRSCIDALTEILTGFRKTGNNFINTRLFYYILGLYRQVGWILAVWLIWHSGLYRQVWLILAQWLIQAGVADNGTMAYTGRYG